MFRRLALFPLVLGCIRPLVGVDTESSEVIRQTTHPLFTWIDEKTEKSTCRVQTKGEEEKGQKLVGVEEGNTERRTSYRSAGAQQREGEQTAQGAEGQVGREFANEANGI